MKKSNILDFSRKSIVIHYLIGFSFLVISFKLGAQERNDCIRAKEICNLGNYYISSLEGPGFNEELDLGNSKLKETFSYWFKFEASSSGKMEFLIVPDQLQDDFDFVLYKGSRCDNKQPLRIMTSGEIVGRRIISKCIGQTGLQIGSHDVTESDGCYNFDDNFLSPVLLEKNYTYYLFVNNFNSRGGFTILFDGDESLELKKICALKESPELQVHVFPNPTVDIINVSLNRALTENAKIQIFDLSGKLHIEDSFDSIPNQLKFNVNTLPSGKYFVRVGNKSIVGMGSFVKGE